MIHKIDLIKCWEANLTPTQFTYLNCIHTNQKFPWPIPNSQKKLLEEEGWIKLTSKGVVIREKFRTFIGVPDMDNREVSAWIQEWRNLWPTGVKSGGRPVKGDKKGCLIKMEKFAEEYNYSKSEIFEATRIYIFEKSRDNYKYMTCADYFILKNGASTLASFCEDVNERGSTLTEAEEGSNKFFKSV